MKYLVLIAALLLAACAEKIEPAAPAGAHYEIPAFDWHVVDREELQRVYLGAGMPIPEGRELRGFVGVRDGRTVIYTLPPRTVDDDVATTLGHEVMHVALGDYHR